MEHIHVLSLIHGCVCKFLFKVPRDCEGFFLESFNMSSLLVTPNHPSLPAFQKEMTSRMCH